MRSNRRNLQKEGPLMKERGASCMADPRVLTIMPPLENTSSSLSGAIDE